MVSDARAVVPPTAAPSTAPTRPVNVPELTRELEELIAALDRRVQRVEQAGEADIARDAAALRAKAVDRLAELTRDANAQPATESGTR
jgi:hypothetical protein